MKRLEQLPGAVAASATAVPVLGGSVSVGISSESGAFCTPDLIAKGVPNQPTAANTVLPRYFETMGMRLVSGRDFTWADNAPGPWGPTIVNEAFARVYFSGSDALGQNLGLNCPAAPAQFTIVGVVSDGRRTPRLSPEPTIYVPLRGDTRPITLILRTSTDAAAMIPTVRRAITEVNASIPTFSEATLDDLRERHLRRERLLSDLLMIFGSVTLLVCCLGIYGMLSYSVVRRRSEISVRMAIGAKASHIVTMVVRESLLPVGVGIVVGCGVALALNRWFESLLFGVSGSDPLTMAGAAFLFITVAAAAAAIPARSASRVDPVLSLRL